MQHYAKAFIRPEGQKLSITPMYSAWVDLSLVMKWGVKWHAHGWLYQLTGMERERLQKEFDELVEFENEMYGDSRQ